jgi:hypothetical protein
MLKNLPAALQLSKLERLTATLREAFGGRPVAFRAGRYGLGPDTVTALIRCGYRVDSSVTPFVSWEKYDDGPTFIGAPLHPYRLAGDGEVRIPQPDGPLAELPMSVGYNRSPSGVWAGLYRLLSAPALRPLHLRSIVSRAGLVKRISLSPETDSASDMLTLSFRLMDAGLRHLHVFLHSPSLSPGLSPFARDRAGVERVYRSIATYVEGLDRVTALRFVTVSEAATLLQSAPSHEPAAAPSRS